MGWEYRRFVEISEEVFNENYLKGIDGKHSEKRNDSYILVFNKENELVVPTTIGIKFRFNTSLEFKVRKQRNNFGIEKWSKIHTNSKLKSSSMNKNEILNEIKFWLKQSELCDFTNYSNDDLKLIIASTQKIRIGSSTFSYSYEKALFSLEFIENAEKSVKIKKFFKSIALEGVTSLNKIKQEHLSGEIQETSPELAISYPEFIHQIYMK
ncbi:hypothetical protein ABK040_009565 [Willaertia magna]